MNNAARIFFALILALVPAGIYAAHRYHAPKATAGPVGPALPCPPMCSN